MKGPEPLFARDEGAREALCARERGQGRSLRERKRQGSSVCERKGQGQLCARAAGGRGQSHSECKMMGPGQLCAGDEGAKAALREMKGPGQPCTQN